MQGDWVLFLCKSDINELSLEWSGLEGSEGSEMADQPSSKGSRPGLRSLSLTRLYLWLLSLSRRYLILMCSLAPSLWLATFGWTCTNVCSLNWEVTTDVPMHFFDLGWNSNTEAEARGRLADSEMARGRLGFGQFLVLLRFLLVT